MNGDWEHPYLTFQPNFESRRTSKMFKKLYLNGAVYRGRKPIHWCSHCHTALAEAEIEYADETSPSIYVNFKLNNMSGRFRRGRRRPRARLRAYLDDHAVDAALRTPLCRWRPDADYCHVVEADGNVHDVREGAWSRLSPRSPAGRAIVLRCGRTASPSRMKGDGSSATSPISAPFCHENTGTHHLRRACHPRRGHRRRSHGSRPWPVDDYQVGMKFGVAIHHARLTTTARFTGDVPAVGGPYHRRGQPRRSSSGCASRARSSLMSTIVPQLPALLALP